MKVIISHDVDHLSIREHFGDLVLPKFVGLCGIELVKGNISFHTFRKRISKMCGEDAWNNLEELVEFDKKHGVKSTFFVAVNNALGISYSREQAKKTIQLVQKYGFNVGIHGISYQNKGGIEEEFRTFKDVIGKSDFGIRMHYLRREENTFKYLRDVGYYYESTILSEDRLQQPYSENGLPEFPIHIEDVRLFSPFHRAFSLEKAKEHTKDILNNLNAEDFLNVLFHPRYFSDEFPRYKNWYEWLISECAEKNVKFTNYEKSKNLLKQKQVDTK